MDSHICAQIVILFRWSCVLVTYATISSPNVIPLVAKYWTLLILQKQKSSGREKGTTLARQANQQNSKNLALNLWIVCSLGWMATETFSFRAQRTNQNKLNIMRTTERWEITWHKIRLMTTHQKIIMKILKTNEPTETTSQNAHLLSKHSNIFVISWNNKNLHNIKWHSYFSIWNCRKQRNHIKWQSI